MRLECRLIINEPQPGAWNMAVDEALLESAAADGPPTLRLYRWSEPTLSLGYFQSYVEREGHAASRPLGAVRRSTGGGALVHDHELTYSLALPRGAYAERETRSLYCSAHKAVIAAIGQLGGDTERLSLCVPATDAPTQEPFLCFQRRADGDLLVDGEHKVAGSAQRKRRGALLQHGGVLLAQSTAAPELPGLAELGVARLGAAALAEPMAKKLLGALGFSGQPGGLSQQEQAAAERLRDEKHRALEWLKRR